MRFGQLMGGDAPVIVLFQRLKADRAEDFFGRGELGQQPLEVIGAFDALAQLLSEHRLGSPRRSDNQHMIGRKQGA